MNLPNSQLLPLMMFGSSMLGQAGPQPYPRSFGSALGGALNAGVQGMLAGQEMDQRGRSNRLQELALIQQMNEMQRAAAQQMKRDQAISAIKDPEEAALAQADPGAFFKAKTEARFRAPEKTPDWVQQMNSPEYRAWQLELKKAGKDVTNVNVDVKGETKGAEAAWQKAAEAWDTAQKAELEANRSAPIYQQLDDALKGFQTGATAEMRLKANQILQDLGVKVEGVPEGELIKGLSARLQFSVAPKGQGQITDFERKLVADMVPALGTSVEGNRALMQMAKQLDDYDRKVSAIYREAARKQGSSPNPVDVADELAKLGSPLTSAQMAMLQQAQQGGAAPQAAAPVQPAPTGLPAGAPAPPPGFVVR